MKSDYIIQLQQPKFVLVVQFKYMENDYHLLINSLQIIRLARKLPMGDVNALKASSDTIKDEEEPLDENDLT
jgi:hypothetical protein